MSEKEHWRIDRNSVHFRVLKGWLSERFKGWLVRTAEQHNLSDDELLARIIETIRRITRRTFQVLEKKTGKEVDLPFIIISDNPSGDLGALTTIFKFAVRRDINLSSLCNRALVMSSLISLGFKYDIYLSERAANVCGCASRFGIAIDDWFIMKFFKNIKKSKFCYKAFFLMLVVEEAFHYFANRTDEFQDKEMRREIKEKTKNLGILERDKVGQEIEKKYGVKRMVVKLVRILEKEEEELFSLLPCAK